MSKAKKHESSLEEMEAKVAALEAAALDMTDTIEYLKLENEQLKSNSTGTSARIISRNAPAKVLELPTFTLGEKEYRFRVPAFRFGKGRMDAAAAVLDAGLCAMIVEKYPGLVEEI